MTAKTPNPIEKVLKTYMQARDLNVPSESVARAYQGLSAMTEEIVDYLRSGKPFAQFEVDVRRAKWEAYTLRKMGIGPSNIALWVEELAGPRKYPGFDRLVRRVLDEAEEEDKTREERRYRKEVGKGTTEFSL